MVGYLAVPISPALLYKRSGCPKSSLISYAYIRRSATSLFVYHTRIRYPICFKYLASRQP